MNKDKSLVMLTLVLMAKPRIRRERRELRISRPVFIRNICTVAHLPTAITPYTAAGGHIQLPNPRGGGGAGGGGGEGVHQQQHRQHRERGGAATPVPRLRVQGWRH